MLLLFYTLHEDSGLTGPSHVRFYAKFVPGLRPFKRAPMTKKYSFCPLILSIHLCRNIFVTIYETSSTHFCQQHLVLFFFGVQKKLTIDDESTFCNQKILQTLLKCKVCNFSIATPPSLLRVRVLLLLQRLFFRNISLIRPAPSFLQSNSIVLPLKIQSNASSLSRETHDWVP